MCVCVCVCVCGLGLGRYVCMNICMYKSVGEEFGAINDEPSQAQEEALSSLSLSLYVYI